MMDSRKALGEVTVEFLVEWLMALAITQMGIGLPLIVTFMLNMLIVKLIKICYRRWVAAHSYRIFNAALTIIVWMTL